MLLRTCAIGGGVPSAPPMWLFLELEGGILRLYRRLQSTQEAAVFPT